MEIRQKLVKFKYHIVFAFVFSIIALSLFTWSPSFLSVLSYFWPLLLSTALFLAAVFFFARTSDLPTSSDASDSVSGVKAAAEEILDYVVAEQPEETSVNSFSKLE